MLPTPPELPPPLPPSAMAAPFTPEADPRPAMEMPPPFPPERPAKRRSGARWPVMAWSGLAVVAIAYMSVVALRPDLVARVAPADGQSPLAAWKDETDKSKAAIQTLEASVKSLESEVTVLRTQLAEAERARSMAEASARSAVAAASQPVSATGQAATTGAASTTAATETGALPDPTTSSAAAPTSDAELPLGPNLRLTPAPVAENAKPSAGLQVINSGAAAAVAAAKIPPAGKTETAPVPAPTEMTDVAAPPKAKAANEKTIETGSVEKPVTPDEIPAFGEPIIKPEPKTLGLAIGTGPSVDTLRLNWSLISETNAEQLRNLEPRYRTSVDGNGLVYNLLAGPVKSKAHGRELCKALTKRAIPCSVVEDFGGEAF